MKNNQIDSLMQDYKELELAAHATIDDAMHKVTQEIWELLEADARNDRWEMANEAGDVIVNISSVAYELWCEIEEVGRSNEKISAHKLIMQLWDWNAKVQWFRERYSRDDISLEELQKVSNEFISEILQYSDRGVEETLQANIEKFQSRIDHYTPKISIEDYIDNYSDFPIAWIEFKDISPILRSPKAFRYVAFELAKLCRGADVIAGLDARWFLFWPIIAQILNVPFEMIRKKWKLPGECIGTGYELEYGSNDIEMQKQGIQPGEKVAIIDDLLATWGTAEAAVKLVELLWAEVVRVAFVIALNEPQLRNMPSRKILSDYNSSNLISYE